MEQTRKKMKFEILIERYFSNFFSILLTNLLFFIPLAVAFALCYLVSLVGGGVLLNLLTVAILVLTFPFYAGVVLVVRNMARGDKDVRVFSTFVKGVKDNYARFLLFGVILSVICLFSFYSISMYSKLLSSSWIFYALLIICILIVLEVLFMFFYIPLMSVTFDLSLKHVFKNSFLMSFGEIKNNFFALISLAVVLAICFTLTAFSTIEIILIIVTILLFALIIPASCQFVVSFFVFDDMYGSIASKDAKAKEISDAIAVAKENKGDSIVFVDDYSDVDISTLKDTDEYTFYKGKMIKQSVLLKRVLEQRATQDANSNEDV